MVAHLIGGDKLEGTFVRMDGHSLQLGVVITYRLSGMNFAIIISRNGVELAGRYPCVARQGVEALTDMLNRAIRHHEHLKSFPVGEQQTTIPERLFEEEEAQRDARIAKTKTDDKVM